MSTKKFFKRAFLIILALAMLVPLVACAGSGSGGGQPSGSSSTEKITVRIGTTGARGHIVTEWMFQFAEALNEKTDRFNVETYPSSQFGTTNEMVEAVIENNLQGLGVPTAYWAPVLPLCNVLDIPYLFPDPVEAFKILNSGIDYLTDAFQGVGLYPLAFPRVDPMWLVSTTPVDGVADLRGMSTRGLNSDVWLDIYKAFGSNPVVLTTADVPMALQTGQIQGWYCPYSMAYSMAIGIADYYIAIPETPMLDVFIFNNTFIQSLSEADRKIFLDTAKEVTFGVNYEMSVSMSAEYLEAFDEAGMRVIFMNDELDAELRAALMPIKDNFPANYPDLADGFYGLSAAIESFKG